MALHESLTDLSELAAHCQSPATARGLLAESQDLVRNAYAHRTNELELASWFSRVVTDIVRSHGLGSPVRLTGAAARGDLLPSMPITWLGKDPELEALLEDVNLDGHSVAEDPTTRADAGLAVSAEDTAALLEAALALRPHTLSLVDGLPDPQAEADVHRTLLAPIAAIARWACPESQSTVDRLAIGVARELLAEDEAEALQLAWATGLALELAQWNEGMAAQATTLGSLPPLYRSAYGSACRSVSAVCGALAARHAATPDTNAPEAKAPESKSPEAKN
ncbi:hypothetical protein [Corynebacterium sp.]|uniref:hypothetical protein n=1 Tax=Corynebacterium sp. TaxID=1720 RepID=UPI0026DCA15D|nr:hypothetical protein [Corynebacterium sp.]MDO5032673.1 hypothetical protein [Corynebacterium sp.]